MVAELGPGVLPPRLRVRVGVCGRWCELQTGGPLLHSQKHSARAPGDNPTILEMPKSLKFNQRSTSFEDAISRIWLPETYFGPHDSVCTGNHGKSTKKSSKKSKWLFPGQWCRVNDVFLQAWPSLLKDEALVESRITLSTEECQIEPLACPVEHTRSLTTSLLVSLDGQLIAYPDQVSHILLHQFGVIVDEKDDWSSLLSSVVPILLVNTVIEPGFWQFHVDSLKLQLTIHDCLPSPSLFHPDVQFTPIINTQSVEEVNSDHGELADALSSLTIANPIAGMDIPVKLLSDLLEVPMKYSAEMTRLGIDPPKGVLLHGPSGVGKTMLVHYMTSKLNAKLFTIHAVDVFTQQGEVTLKKKWQEANKHSAVQPVVVLIEDVDVIAPKRSPGKDSKLLAQLLTLMDGISKSTKFFVIATTTRPNNIDAALRRPGRLEREIAVTVPDQEGRRQIIQQILPLVDCDVLARATPGFTGADLLAVAREAKHLGGGEATLHHVQQTLSIIKTANHSHSIEYLHGSSLSWQDVGGLESVKRALRQAVEWPNLYPETFSRLGLTRPRGILLFGPPGCSKTRLVRVMAHVVGVQSFLTINAANLYSSFVGESERILREVFSAARLAQPSIVFLDEVDALAGSRDELQDVVQSRILSTLLNEMDGVGESSDVLVVAATNRPNSVDSALLRPGRFDRCIYVPLPDEEARLQILKIHTRDSPLHAEVDLWKLAQTTTGYSGADLETLVREAALNAVQNQRSSVMNCDLEIGFQRLGGPSISKEQLVEFERLAGDFERG